MCERLKQDILWADYVFISAMIAQKDSARQVADRCRALGVRVVGGGPLFRAYPDGFADLDTTWSSGKPNP